MATSIFDEKECMPNEGSLKKVLGKSTSIWDNLIKYLNNSCGELKTEWKFYSKNAGWCLKIADGKNKNIVFLLPNIDYFIVTINMGVEVSSKAMKAGISNKTKALIKNAKIYMEGISILIKIGSIKDLDDVKTILKVKDDK